VGGGAVAQALSFATGVRVPWAFALAMFALPSLVACIGAIYLGGLALRDWRIVSADTRDMRRRLVRRETSGILLRSGTIRALTMAMFVWASAASIASGPRVPVDIGTALVSDGLAVLTLYFTIRDVVARHRISANQ